MKTNKLTLPQWFRAFYRVGDDQTDICSLSPKRKLGITFSSTWLPHNKKIQAMSVRKQANALRGEHHAETSGRGSQVKVPVAAAAYLDKAYPIIRAKKAKVLTFPLGVIADLAQDAP
jgi:hypothetical protein